ncbi:hypothetical protein [Burkholderia guangdongensis]|uniref:hypothetical protein n=1 Tax=Burkholderia guangdongensis TaxID=1792500 RepID=UPI0015CD6070|nr:hypothetical protein [Burkholderia guangdongensis]
MRFRSGVTRIPPETERATHAGTSGLGRVELDPRQDRHARAALEAYADSAATEMPWLAEWLRTVVPATHPGFTYCAATVERLFGAARAWAAQQPDYAPGAWDEVGGQLAEMLRRSGEPAERSADRTE